MGSRVGEYMRRSLLSATFVVALLGGLLGPDTPPASAQPAPPAPACLPGDVLQSPELPPVGTSRQLVLYVDFPDAPAERPVGDETALFDPVDDFYAAVSHGRLDVRVDHEERWLRMSRPSGEYGIERGLGFDVHYRYVKEAVDLADPLVDFGPYESVHVVPSPGSDGITVSAALAGPVSADEGVMRVSATYDRSSIARDGSRIAIHETGHLFGLKDLYPYGSDVASDRFVGSFDVMGISGGQAPGTFGFHRRGLGWTDPGDVACVTDAGTTAVELRPLSSDSGPRLAVVPTGPFEVVAVEYRTAEGVDEGLCRAGVLVYEVDERLPNGAGSVSVVDPTPGDTRGVCVFPKDDAALQPGDALAVPGTGVTVRVAAADAGSARIEIARDAAAPVRLPRLAGFGRVETATTASRAAFGADEAGAVVLARLDGFADALAGTPLAVRSGGPVLLTLRDRLLRGVRAELDRVLPDGGRVYVLGSEAAVGPAVEAELAEAGYDVRRVGGPDRYATAVRIAEELGSPADVLLANGLDFPGALSAGTAAADVGAAVLLTAGGRPVRATDTYLAAHPGGTRRAIGGPAARAHPAAEPVVGVDRYDTAVRVARTLLPDSDVLAVARADAFPDALSAGGVVGPRGGPVLLAPREGAVPTVVRDLLCERQGRTRAAPLLGSEAALSREVADQLAGALSGASCG